MNDFINVVIDSAKNELCDLKEFILYFNIRNKKIDRIILEIENQLKNFNIDKIDIKLFQLYFNVRLDILKNNVHLKFKSPIFTENIIKTNITPFDYERAMNPDSLDIKLKKIFFRSGMSAINGVLMLLSSFKFLKNSSLLFSSTYFETKNLVNNFYNNYFLIKNKEQDLIWYDLIKSYDIIFFDIIDCSNLQKTIDIKKLINSLNGSNKSIIFLVVDITIECLDFDFNYVVNNINDKKIIIFCVNSLIKLNQFGFEFFNLGSVEIYSNIDYEYIEIIYEKLKSFRTFSGTSLTHLEELIFNNEIFSVKNILNYKKNIYSNTDYLFSSIVKNSCLDIKFSEGISPYILLKINFRSDLKFYRDFIFSLKKFLLSNKTFISNGTSFGFRHIRAEIVKTNCDNFLRISPGVYRGLNFFLTIEFIKNFKGGDSNL